MNHQIDHGNINHRFAALWQRFVIFTQSSIFAQPGKRTLNDPTFGQHHELVKIVALDDFNHAATSALAPIDQLTRVAAVGPDQLQACETSSQTLEYIHRANAILNVSRMNQHRQNQTKRINDDMSLSTRDLLSRVVTTIPPFDAVVTDCESITAALGVGFLPTWRRTFSRSLS